MQPGTTILEREIVTLTTARNLVSAACQLYGSAKVDAYLVGRLHSAHSSYYVTQPVPILDFRVNRTGMLKYTKEVTARVQFYDVCTDTSKETYVTIEKGDYATLLIVLRD